MLNRTLALVALLFTCSCGLFGPAKSKDPLADLTLAIQTYRTNTPTSIPENIDGVTGSGWSNRNVQFFFSNYSEKITKLDLQRVINGVTTHCDAKDVDGHPMVNRNMGDWAGTTTEYTLTVTADTFTKVFGPYTINVQSADRVVTGGHGFGDQTNDMITTSGPFFQSRTVDIGTGGYSGANFSSIQAQYQARLIDFAFLTVGSNLQAVSPSLIQTTQTFDRLINDCGYQTTSFVAYTGTLDPEVGTGLTLAEVMALPDPPASATTLTVSNGLKFVYKTSDGKKGLIKIGTITTAVPRSLTVSYSSAQ